MRSAGTPAGPPGGGGEWPDRVWGRRNLRTELALLWSTDWLLIGVGRHAGQPIAAAAATAAAAAAVAAAATKGKPHLAHLFVGAVLFRAVPTLVHHGLMVVHVAFTLRAEIRLILGTAIG